MVPHNPGHSLYHPYGTLLLRREFHQQNLLLYRRFALQRLYNCVILTRFIYFSQERAPYGQQSLQRAPCPHQ